MNKEQTTAIQLQLQYDAQYQKIWKQIIEPNQRLINQEPDQELKRNLQLNHNTLTAALNAQYDIFNELLRLYVLAPTKSENDFNKNLVRTMRQYIKNLGGNPSNCTYILNNEY